MSRGFIGFGAALIVVPSLVALYGPVEAVLIMSLIEVPGTLYLIPTTVRHADWRLIAPLGLASLVTIPLGGWALAELDPERLSKAIAGLVIALGLLIASGWRYRRPVGLVGQLAVGGLSGFVSGLANVGGPIAVAFLLASRVAAAGVRAGMMAYFSFSTFFRLAVYAVLGLFAWDAFELALGLAPFYVLGIWAGGRLFARVSERAFRRAAVTVVLATGVIALIK